MSYSPKAFGRNQPTGAVNAYHNRLRCERIRIISAGGQQGNSLDLDNWPSHIYRHGYLTISLAAGVYEEILS